jgi:tetratricopeptide (TPR) repeat protein
MRTIFTVFLFLSIFALDGFSQRRALRTAQSHLDNDRFAAALKVLQPLMLAEKVNKEAHLLSGIAYLNEPGGSERALELFDIAIEHYPLTNKPERRALEARFYKGQALHLNYQFEEALLLYRELLKVIPSSEEDLAEAVKREIAYSETAMHMIQNPVPFEIQSMGRAFNSAHDDHSPVVALDESTIYFTSNRPISELDNRDGQYFENIYVSHWRDGAWTAATRLELPGNYYGNQATVSLSPDGNSLVFFQNDGIIGNLYESRLVFGEWTEPVPFPAPINSGYNESHVSMSIDGERLFFASDRPGGYGGKDLYVSHLLPNGFWGDPLNLGPQVNTALNEESPFLHPDGRTLYYSSEGHASMGGYDIFSSELSEDGEWSEASNMGYPINTPDDDVFFMPTPDGQRVYYASRQPDGYGSTDIYLITFPSDDDRSLAVVASHIFDEGDSPYSDAIIRIYDAQNDLLQGIYRPNSLTGKFIAVLPTGRSYRMVVEAPGFDTYEEAFTVEVREVYGTRQRAHYLEPVNLKRGE